MLIRKSLTRSISMKVRLSLMLILVRRRVPTQAAHPVNLPIAITNLLQGLILPAEAPSAAILDLLVLAPLTEMMSRRMEMSQRRSKVQLMLAVLNRILINKKKSKMR
jgi:hypothetical protein